MRLRTSWGNNDINIIVNVSLSERVTCKFVTVPIFKKSNYSSQCKAFSFIF